MLDVLRANLVALPLRAASVDAVVSLQTVEHLWDQPGFVAECVRVLRPGGLLAVSTPNRLTFPAGNPFHVRELDAGELVRLLAPRAADLHLLGVHHGQRIRAFETRRGGLVGAQLERPHAEWDDELAAFVAGVQPADFVVSADTPRYPVHASLDLLAIGSAR
jgi:SAM-dependent methyltransferase